MASRGISAGADRPFKPWWVVSLTVAAFLTGKVAIGCAHRGMSEFGHRSCKCGAVYDRSEHIEEAREISSFECAVCGKTIENWNSAWVPRYRFIACRARDAEFPRE